MRKLLPALVIFLILTVWIGLKRDNGFASPGAAGKAGERHRRISEGAVSGDASIGKTKRIEGVPGPGERYSEARAYRFSLDRGSCELRAVEELSGDFRQPRSMLAAEGMFHCRLLDEAGNFLAETTMHPPDRRCVVLDPTSAGADGKPAPVRLTAEGPVVFQVRLPSMEGGTSLEIVRLAGTGLPEDGSRPKGELVAKLDLTP